MMLEFKPILTACSEKIVSGNCQRSALCQLMGHDLPGDMWRSGLHLAIMAQGTRWSPPWQACHGICAPDSSQRPIGSSCISFLIQYLL